MIVLSKSKGFSLLEILVAFTIMAVALTVILRIFGSGVNNAVISEEYNVAVQMAESLLARTGVDAPLVIGETSGVEVDKYQWLVRVNLLSQTPVTNTNTLQNESAQVSSVFAVTVIVAWGNDGRSLRSVELHSLKYL